MKPFEYILKFIYMLAVSLGISLGVGPLLVQTGLKKASDDTFKSKIEELKVEFLNPGNTSYIRLNVKLENDQEIEKIMSIRDQQHQPLIKYLREEGFVSEGPIKEWIPLQLNASKFTKGREVNYKWGSDDKIVFLSIQEHPLIGKVPTPVKRILLVVLGIIFTGFGIFLLILGCMLFYNNYKIYSKTGVLPELPNTVDDMKEGLKFLFNMKSNR